MREPADGEASGYGPVASRLMALQPAEALRRVAYLLERERADTYKVRAFRRAATTVDVTPLEELEELALARHLTDLEGVG